MQLLPFSVKLPPAPVPVDGDFTPLAQVVTGVLLNNAVKIHSGRRKR